MSKAVLRLLRTVWELLMIATLVPIMVGVWKLTIAIDWMDAKLRAAYYTARGIPFYRQRGKFTDIVTRVRK